MQNQKTSKAMKIGIIFMKSRKSEQKIKGLAAGADHDANGKRRSADCYCKVHL